MANTSFHTVKVTFSGLDQSNNAVAGKLCMKLNETAIIDNTVIAGDTWFEAEFNSATGKAVLEVVPNELIGMSSFYEFKIQIQGSAYVKTIQHGFAYVPDKNCNLSDIIIEVLPGGFDEVQRHTPRPTIQVGRQPNRPASPIQPYIQQPITPGSALVQIKLARDAALEAQEKAEAAATQALDIRNQQNSVITKINDYLYSLEYDDLDYESAFASFESKVNSTDSSSSSSGCSSIRFGGLTGRNYDAPYNEEVSFVVRTKNMKGRYATIGVASSIGIEKADVEDRSFLSRFKEIPFYLVDGMNEMGLTVMMNTVPGMDLIDTYSSNTGASVSVCNRMLVRYILDNFKSAKKAAETIRDSVNVYGIGVEYSYLISDSASSYVVEFIRNVCTIYDVTNNLPYLTNFYRTYAGLNADRTVDTAKVTAHSSGIERFDIITKGISTLTGLDGLYGLLTSLRMSNSYDANLDPIWKSDFLMGIYTVNTPIATMMSSINAKRNAYAVRERDGITVHTEHCSMYDMVTKTLYLYNQEGDKQYVFGMVESNLGDLKTEDKTSIIAAINELVNKYKELDKRVVFVLNTNL